MASREKKPLAPSKAKQKANNDSTLPSNEIRSRKGKPLSNLKQQQLARDILEAVATGSQLPPKLEASLPRKKVLRNLKRKQKLRVAKANLIKSKVTRKVANRSNLCRITSDIKKGVRTKRVKLTEESSVKASDSNSRVSEHRVHDTEGESTGTETINRSAKNALRTKKTKFISRNSGEIKVEDIQDTDTDSVVGSNTKISPKLSRKGKSSESSDSFSKSIKPTKFSGLKRSSIREKDSSSKNIEGDIKCTKGRKSSSKDIDSGRASAIDTKFSKSILDAKNSIDLTIDEVIASMLSDTEIDNQQGATEKIEGKVTRRKKMLVEENTVADIEIKKEPDNEDVKIISDGENLEGESFQSAIQLRKRSGTSVSQRSLRNGKLRQSDSGISSDLDFKKRRRLNSDDPNSLDVSIDNTLDSNVDTESSFSESSGNDSQTVTVAAKDESCSKQETVKNCEDSPQTGLETENNNNSDRVDRSNEVGPTLRSKTKAKSTEVEMKNDNIKVEYTRIVSKNTEAQEEKKISNLDQVRKDNILAKFTDKSKSRRSSLNIDMKKTVNSFYNTDKSDGSPKSQIDQMIENIKLKIAKSIESKIFGPEKALGLSKSFEVPKIEEIIAPLSAESQKLGLEENADEDTSTISKNEIKSDSSENSVPKVADTAKEIEKLVMGDIEPTETHSQNIQESESLDTEGNNSTHNASETLHIVENSDSSKIIEEEANGNSSTTEELEKCLEESADDSAKTVDDKRSTTVRKSVRIIDKGSPENANTETAKKVNRVTNKLVQKSENCEESSSQDTNKTSADIASNDEPLRNEPTEAAGISEPSNDDTEIVCKQVEERLTKEDATTDQIVENEAQISLSTSVESQDPKTVENNSEEEGLVTEDQSNNQLEIITEVGKDKQVSNAASSREPSSSLSKSSEFSLPESDNVEQETPVSRIDDPEKNDIEDKSKTTESGEKIETTSSEVVQDTEKDESNCEASVISDSDLDLKRNENVSNTSNPIENAEESNDNPKEDKDKEVSTSSDTSVTCTEPNGENPASKKNSECTESSAFEEEGDKSLTEPTTEEHKSPGEDNKRVLRARDKTKKNEKEQTSPSKERGDNPSKAKTEEENVLKKQGSKETEGTEEVQDVSDEKVENALNMEQDADDAQNNGEVDANDSEPQARTRRSKEVKKRKEDQVVSLKTKRAKREVRKSDQNKEETLLDNEVAKINENNQSFLDKYENGAECANNFRGFSEGGRSSLEKCQDSTDNLRSKSENDLIIAKEPDKTIRENRLSRNLSENHMTKRSENTDILDGECKRKTPETSQKDSDEVSTSGESSSSVNVTPKILETPEDKAKKESILRLLGLESLEKAAERLNNQKAKKEQYTGTLKTVIRVQKEKEKDKRRSRSPLKMVVLKQGRGDGEGDSPEFYTIQKEFGTSGLGDSSSGANRKFSTNHRHSCDEDNEDAAPKDRQSLVIPEKSSSFSIHPGRLCADVCCYCFGKFGSLDTPMHLAQMKSDERRKKILNIERHLTKDSCLCDACYRHVDRKANTSPTNMQTKPQKQHRQLMVSKCSARDCRDAARHHVKRRWLLKIKAGLQNQVDIDWESSQHTSMSFCVSHYSKIERFLTCALCKRRLARNHTHQLANAETEELNQLLGQQGVPVVLAAGTFVCKLCRYFTQLQLKYKDVENMNTNHRSFFKSYRKRILHYHDIEVEENEDDESTQNQSKDKEKRKKKCQGQSKSGSSKSPDGTANSASEKSTPEPSKNEGASSEPDNDNRGTKGNSLATDESVPGDVQFLGLESTVEKLKKRKLLEMHSYSTAEPAAATISCDSPNEVVEILAMDKEVTLTRLPKRSRTSNDITPVVQRLGANPSISVRTLFPGEEEMNLHANIEFTNVREITPQGWEKCATMIQYDRDTKLLWQELQRPYGNQSSFLRHLILLEKYYRSGDLILAPNASRNAINYSTSVQNRLISYEGPEKVDEPIMEPIASEYHNSRRLSGGYVLERDRMSLPSTSAAKIPSTQQPMKSSPPRVLKLNPGVSIIKKPPPNLQRLNLPSTSATANGNAKRKDGQKAITAGGKVFQLSEPDFKRLQSLKKQKQLLAEKQQSMSPSGGGSASSAPSGNAKTPSTAQYQKAQLAAHTQFQKHLRMQQEMLNRQTRGDFEPLICDIRTQANENSPTQNLLHNLNLPKSIQVTTKTSSHIPILPKIPKSLTVIPQTVTRPAEK